MTPTRGCSEPPTAGFAVRSLPLSRDIGRHAQGRPTRRARHSTSIRIIRSRLRARAGRTWETRVNESIQVLGLVLLIVLVAYVGVLGTRLKRLEESNRILLQGLGPSQKVRQLAADPENRLEAMRAFREETGAGVKAAIAVVDALLAARR